MLNFNKATEKWSHRVRIWSNCLKGLTNNYRMQAGVQNSFVYLPQSWVEFVRVFSVIQLWKLRYFMQWESYLRSNIKYFCRIFVRSSKNEFLCLCLALWEGTRSISWTYLRSRTWGIPPGRSRADIADDTLTSASSRSMTSASRGFGSSLGTVNSWIKCKQMKYRR